MPQDSQNQPHTRPHDSQEDSTERSFQHDRELPPSSTVDAGQTPIGASEDQATTLTSPTNTDPPAFNYEPPPPSYEGATADRLGHVRLGSTNASTPNQPIVTTTFMNANSSISMNSVNSSEGTNITRRSGANGSTVHNISITGRNFGGIQVGAVSGGVFTVGNGGVTIQTRRTDDRGNTVSHNFSNVRIGNVHVGSSINTAGGENARSARNITVANSNRRPRSPSQCRSARSSDRSEDESSDSESDDDRWYGRTNVRSSNTSGSRAPYLGSGGWEYRGSGIREWELE